MTAPVATGNDRARYGQDVPALVERGPGGNQRPAALGRLDHDHRCGQATDNAIP